MPEIAAASALLKVSQPSALLSLLGSVAQSPIWALSSLAATESANGGAHVVDFLFRLVSERSRHRVHSHGSVGKSREGKDERDG